MKETQSKTQPVIIGGMVMDLRGQPEDKLKLHTSNPGFLHQTPGGVGRNICENLIRLGVDPFFITAVGDDILGQILSLHGKNIGLNPVGIYQLKDKTTALYLAVLDEQGELLAAIADMTIFETLTPEYILVFKEKLSKAPIIVADTNIPQETLTSICEFCNNNGISLWVEPVSAEKSKKLLPILGKICYISPDINELEALTGLKINSLDCIYQACQILLETGLLHILVTLGADGAILATHDDFTHFPAIPTKVVDVTGAGDAFVAGTLFGLLNGLKIQKSIQYGLITAKMTIETTGTVSGDLNPETIQQVFVEVYSK